jgi:hypothetical protein
MARRRILVRKENDPEPVVAHISLPEAKLRVEVGVAIGVSAFAAWGECYPYNEPGTEPLTDVLMLASAPPTRLCVKRSGRDGPHVMQLVR